MIPILLLITATFRPAQPTIGDPITIDFQASSEQRAASGPSGSPLTARRAPIVVLDRSAEYDILSTRGSRVIIRSFEPRPFPISGRVGNVVFRNLIVPMRTVLKPRDDLRPAPLKPPRSEAYPRLPFVAIGIAALLAAAMWTAVILLARRASATQAVEPPLPADIRFRRAVIALRDDPRAERRWARLADATRQYLAAIDPNLGVELTTRELLSVGQTLLSVPSQAGVPAPHHVISEILRQGDLEKFSPWGALPADFAGLATRALELAPEPVVEQEEEAAA